MWYKTKQGLNVFNVKHNNYIYQLTNEPPMIGDTIMVSLEHDPVHFVTCRSFNDCEQYPLNKEYKYGIVPLNLDLDFYGVGKLVWTNDERFNLK